MSPVTELAPVLIWMSDADKRCTDVNATWQAFTGRTLEALLADGWRETIHADDLPRCLDVLDAAFERRRPFTLEYRLRRHDGEYRWVLDSGIPLLAPDGSLTGYVGSSADITSEAGRARCAGRVGAYGSAAARGHWQLAMECEHGRSRLVGRAVPHRRTGARLAGGRRSPSSAPVSAGTLGTHYPVRGGGDAIRHAVRTRRGDVQPRRPPVGDRARRRQPEADALLGSGAGHPEPQRAETCSPAAACSKRKPSGLASHGSHDDIGQRLALLSIALTVAACAEPASDLHRSIAALSRDCGDCHRRAGTVARAALGQG